MLFGEEYEVMGHPGAAGTVPFLSEGSRARVVQLLQRSNMSKHALKYFKKRFQNAEHVASTDGLAAFSDIVGMEAARRRVVRGNEPVVRSFAELEHAVLMPWLEGKTWADTITAHMRRATPTFTPQDALSLINRFLELMVDLDRRGFAHADLSAGNLIIDADGPTVRLLDLEEAFFEDATRPQVSPMGTPGYQCAARKAGEWSAHSDRFATAIVIAELLLLTTPGTGGGDDMGLFAPDPQASESDWAWDRVDEIGAQLAPRLAQQIAAARIATTLAECPSPSLLAAACRNDRTRLDSLPNHAWNWEAFGGASGVRDSHADTLETMDQESGQIEKRSDAPEPIEGASTKSRPRSLPADRGRALMWGTGGLAVVVAAITVSVVSSSNDNGPRAAQTQSAPQRQRGTISARPTVSAVQALPSARTSTPASVEPAVSAVPAASASASTTPTESASVPTSPIPLPGPYPYAPPEPTTPPDPTVVTVSRPPM